MKTTILVISIVFLAMLGSVSPLPVSNTNYTKEYIANELQKTDLEPAKLMEYLAQLMQKPGTGEGELFDIPDNYYATPLGVIVSEGSFQRINCIL